MACALVSSAVLNSMSNVRKPFGLYGSSLTSSILQSNKICLALNPSLSVSVVLSSSTRRRKSVLEVTWNNDLARNLLSSNQCDAYWSEVKQNTAWALDGSQRAQSLIARCVEKFGNADARQNFQAFGTNPEDIEGRYESDQNKVLEPDHDHHQLDETQWRNEFVEARNVHSDENHHQSDKCIEKNLHRHDHVHGHSDGHVHDHIRGRGDGHDHADCHDHDHDDGHEAKHDNIHEHEHSHAHNQGHAHHHKHGHDHEHNHHGHSHGHGHHSHGAGGTASRNVLQKGLWTLFQTLRLTMLADYFRDSIRWACTSLALLLLAAAIPRLLAPSTRQLVQNCLIGAAFTFTGIPAVLDSAVDLCGGQVNIHVLMALAALASIFMGNALEGALLLAMFSLSHSAEDFFTEKALGDVKALRENNPETALVLNSFDKDAPLVLSTMAYTVKPVREVAVGDLVLVKAGEVVPVDGTVWQGRSNVTVEHLTGETQPLAKEKGDSLPGGARLLEGMLIVQAIRVWQESTVARIMLLTEEASRNRPTLQRWLDTFTERYSQVVVVASVAVALLGPLVFRWPFLTTAGATGSLYRALGFMVAASPCALAVAPLAYATAISACAQKGILLRGGHALDALAACDRIAFDKTGTLTTGDLVCTSIEPLSGHVSNVSDKSAEDCCSPDCEMKALAIAAALEQAATHPIARAVLEMSEQYELPPIAVEGFETLPGQGVTATVFSPKSKEQPRQQARLGSVDYIATSAGNNVESADIRRAAKASRDGEDHVLAALSVGQKVTLFHFEDKVRAGADIVTAQLRDHAGLRLLMLTGDHDASATQVGTTLGIAHVLSQLKPEDKLSHVSQLAADAVREKRGGLVMVGDGINDAPALAAATVGVVLAERASATAIAAADILLLQSNLDGLPFVIAKAQQTTLLVKQNVALALACIFVAAFPAVLGLLPLWLTVLVHEGGTLLVCLNSIRALNRPILRNRKSTNKIVTTISHIANILKRDVRSNHMQSALT